MKIYQPQIKITLIKSRHRDKVVGNTPAVQYRYKAFDGIDLTPLLGDGSVVHTTKSVRMPAGAFSIRFADQPHPEFLESVYALVEPMDIIEIRMAHSETSGGKIPLVMRGLVSSINRQEMMQGDKPVRLVTVGGHDFAKLMQIYRITYLPFTEQADSALATFRFFQEFAPDGVNKSMKANDFVQLVVNNILTPYMAGITALAKADAVGAKSINRWRIQSSIEGAVNPTVISHFTDVSLYELMKTVLDIGPFNEMFVEDWEDGPVLFVRPAPFKNGDDEFVQGVTTSLNVPSVDIVALNVSRSDEGVANYFWVTSSDTGMMTNMNFMERAAQGSPDSFVKFDGLNCSKSLFGIRKMEVKTALNDEAAIYSDAPKMQTLTERKNTTLFWTERRRRLLADLNQDNVLFESGSMRIRGNEKVKAGTYLNLMRGVKQSGVGEVYAHTVTHEFAVNGNFFTTVQFGRGTGFIERAQRPNSMYLDELEAQGVR